MRITERQHSIIVQEVRRSFGPDATVRLFGSRIDDSRRGGDIDLYIETSCNAPDELVDARLRLLTALDGEPSLEGQKIDVVIRSPLHTEERSIDHVARREGIRL